MTLAAATPLVNLTEKEWAAQVHALAASLGWKRYHTYRSDRSEPGWPDEALVRERLLFLELKAERGKFSTPQREWLRALHTADVEVYVARPHNLQHLADILSTRTRYGDFPSDPRGEKARVARSALLAELRTELA